MKQLTAAERKLIEPIDAAAMLSRTERWCAINSHTGNLAGLAAQEAELAEALAALPGTLESVEPAPVEDVDSIGHVIEVAHGRHLVLRVRPEADRRFVLTGHMDTVYPADHPFREARWIDGDTLNAPGAADMKGGIALMIAALEAFEASPGAATVGYDVMINSDEESGSRSSAALIAELARGKHAALTYEPAARPDGTLAHKRGGSGNYAVIVHGRSAHAGRNPEEGRNAVVAAGALAVALHELRSADLKVNPAKIEGGSGNNVVPNFALLRFNVRPQSREAVDSLQREISVLLRTIETRYEVSTALHGGVTRPPKPVDAQAQALFDLVQRTGADLGQAIGWIPSGGVCDGNNIAAMGVPVVDTMGARGGAIHSPDEYLIVPSLAERAALSALVLHRLASGDAA